MKHDVVIIGAGLGGLQCAYILAKQGMNVCVLEKERQAGGCLQTYRRMGHVLDTGFHYVGGLDEGQPLHRLFSYFNLTGLPWKRLDSDAFDEVCYQGRSYFYANGYDNFARRLAEDFPHQRQQLMRYADFLRQVGDGITDSFKPRKADEVYTQSLFSRSALDFLKESFSDDTLLQVLSGTSLKMELHPRLPLYIFAQINSSFVQSAWRLQGGGSLIADRLTEQIQAMGGVVRTGAEVVALREDESNITAATLAGGEEVEARWFISNLHPAATMQLLDGSRLVRRIYRNRLSSLQNTFGMFTASCLLRPHAVPSLNRNQYVYTTDNLWTLYSQPTATPRAMLISYLEDADGYASCMDLLCPMSWQEVEQWEQTRVMHRGSDYEAMKQLRAEQCIGLAERFVPALKGNVERVFTSTPLTWRDYTATAQGAAYGIRKDCDNLMFTLLTPRTTAQNLLLTGQNLNLHGILGVSMTSFMTCSTLLGTPIDPF